LGIVVLELTEDFYVLEESRVINAQTSALFLLKWTHSAVYLGGYFKLLVGTYG
jgi:hypothetical protein